MRVELEKWACAPIREHEKDAGIDLRSPVDVTVPAGESATIDTGVHVELPDGSAGLLVSKSGLNVNYDITSTGLIDRQYTGSIKVKLYNHGRTDYHVTAGDKISQLVVVWISTPTIELVGSLQGGKIRGDNGFGSTGK